MKYRHILLTTDLSDDARRAYGHATDLAREHGAKITLLHIVEAARAIPHGAPFAPPMPAPGVAAMLDDAKTELRAIAESFSGVEVEFDAVVAGEVAVAIDSEADQRGCDLIVLSTHGRSGLRRLVLGSVAEAVLRHAHMPVLAIPPAK